MNICLAVGPETSRTIKREYLKNNEEYLVRTLEVFLDNVTKVAARQLSVLERLPGSPTSPGPRPQAAGGANPASGGERRAAPPPLPDGRGNCATRIDKYSLAGCCRKAGENHKAWMSVNSDWKSEVQDDIMEELKLASTRSTDITYPYIAFNNPAVAIQFGLVDVLKYLVEEKGIDINAESWTAFCFGHNKRNGVIINPLPVYAMGGSDCPKHIEMYEYLLGRDDFYFVSSAGRPTLFFHHALQSGDDFLRTLINHPLFDVNRRMLFLTGSLHFVTPLAYVVWNARRVRSEGSVVNSRNVLDALRMLLGAGADPNLFCPVLRRSPLEYARMHRAKAETTSVEHYKELLNAVVRMIEEGR